MSTSHLMFFVVLLSIQIFITYGGTYTFKVDFSSTPTDVYSFWQSSTTFDHAYCALRADFQEQLTTTVKELKIEFIRFHSIFDDSIGILNPRKPTTGNGNSPYSYVNVDKIYDFLQSIGIKPLVEMDFMPSLFVPNNSTYLSHLYEYPVYVGPPTNKTQWYEFVKSFVQHLVDRYGMDTVATWGFDAWNEPNSNNNWCNANGDNLKTFEETWNYTAHAVKSVNKSFIVGAPGSSGMNWYQQFPQWAHDNKVPLDFFSTHIYPNNQGTPPTHNGYLKLLEKLQTTIKSIDPKMQIGNTAYGCTVQGHNHSIGPHDTSYNAVCFSTFASQFQALDRNQWYIWSFTGFSDLWDQQGFQSAPFHDGYGWMTQRGIKKATYHALRLLVEYASNRKYFKVNRMDSSEDNTTLEVFVTMNDAKNQIALFVMNWIPMGQKITDEIVIVELLGLNNNNNNIPSQATIYRIDSNNCNPDVIWQKQGSPIYPTQKQIDEMVNASNTYPNKINITNNNDIINVKVDIPVYGMAVVVIDLQ